MVFGKKDINDTVEKSKTVTRDQPEGSGIHSCTQGECATNPFTTTDKKEFEAHGRGKKLHFQQGAAPCAICEQEVDMNIVLTKTGNKPIHPECQQPAEEL